MRGEKFREASAHASGEVSASAFLVGHLPACAMQEGQVRYSPTYIAKLDSCAEPGVQRETLRCKFSLSPQHLLHPCHVQRAFPPRDNNRRDSVPHQVRH
jgi:hypothetical protein